MTSSLFAPETCFVLEGENAEEVFRQVDQELQALDLVKEGFLDSLIEREKNFPTALDMQPVNPNFSNIAIPHTESDYVTVTRIVPIKLKTPVTFHNMIQPDQALEVGFLFMLLNKDAEAQAGLLAQVMDFFNRTDADQIQGFLASEDPQAIYEFLAENF
ncbi:PTS sugar transporter subunit IIA [Aerococcus sp. UMB8608]|uniref:PTS sugar transporter subunit IIA n=1 Tax=Aerococcus sanguinicola TaxID=119206 RepID=A0A5N1GIJ2_9LACT|nr:MULTISPECIES: PTS sugar transporter subunit IIA [Aerococcus]KAA9300156.1 PTS sugar transporter subunit IIA [Aerococcus sanguinicola]MDK6679985.1 PTS sugar transporter subunit IIA [Aerococcus sp. UMB8608]MDK6686133.1 PTS sugar transporter subunit IIA [Aerococcus sp. UMB8623]MDK6939913.1 PTS sugar transporter subunit IIA [Aerococcus sp. UMB8487]OFK14624.1 PTS mannitol transporter subunit IIB [Aerococcus sp. HMSC072A12]